MDYDDMLDRAAGETSEGATGDRLDLPDPAVRPEGSVTVVENFRALTTQLDREPEHLLQFLQRDLGTSGHIDERGRARLTGSFDADRIGGAVDAYVERFVRCPACGLPDTRLEPDDGDTVVRCTACGERSSAAR